MSGKTKILIVGETWVTHAVHIKGFDSFSTAHFGEGYSYLKRTLEAGGFEVEVIENHVAATVFPETAEALSAYDTIILSDIGANTLLLTPPTWKEARPAPNRLDAIRDYVQGGGGLIMVGGYLTFTGIEGKGFWRNTPVEDCLPVTLLPTDDRREHPEGVTGVTLTPDHPVLAGVPADWPPLLGYNRVVARDTANVLAEVNGDPLLALGESGKGRTAVFTSDCSPHWCPLSFIDWPGYAAMWQNLCGWTSGAK